MFAYCNNNPIGNADSEGGRPYNVGMTDGPGHDPTKPNPIRSCKEGVGTGPITTGFVNGQGREEYQDVTFGVFSFAKNGCGAAGAHNSLLLTGHKSTLRDVLYFFEARRPLSTRVFGIYPWEFAGFYDYHRVSYTRTNNLNALQEHVSSGGTVLITFWNEEWTPFGISTGAPYLFSGAHTVAIQGVGGTCFVYNASNFGAIAKRVMSIADYIEGGVLISGYCLYN